MSKEEAKVNSWVLFCFQRIKNRDTARFCAALFLSHNPSQSFLGSRDYFKPVVNCHPTPCDEPEAAACEAHYLLTCPWTVPEPFKCKAYDTLEQVKAITLSAPLCASHKASGKKKKIHPHQCLIRWRKQGSFFFPNQELSPTVIVPSWFTTAE